MDNKINEFEEYFRELDRRNIYIHPSWFSGDLVEYMNAALAKIMQSKTANYSERSRFRGNNPNEMQEFFVNNFEGRIEIQVKGADDYTCLNIANEIMDKDNQPGKIKTITYFELAQEITKVMAERMQKGDKKALELLTQNGTSELLVDTIKNMTEYYKYLQEEAEIAKKHECRFFQEGDSVGYNYSGNSTGPTKDRVNDIMEFQARKDMLESHKPYDRIIAHREDEKGKALPGYIVYVYRQLLEGINQPQNGYLFIAEPETGDRETRLFYLTEEEYKEFKSDGDKMADITRKYLSMSKNSFNDEKNKTTIIMHTSKEGYGDRINLYITGNNGKTLTYKKYNQETLRKLYGDKSLELPYFKQRKRKSADIGEIGSGANNIDRTAIDSVIRDEKSTEKGVE